MIKIEINEKGQALAPCTKRMGAEAFAKNSGCDIYWLGGGGAMLNCRGTIIMIDPVLTGFDMPPFNGNPERLFGRVVNPKRIRILAPGEKYK